MYPSSDPSWHLGFPKLPTLENEPGGTGLSGRIFIYYMLGAGPCAVLGNTRDKAPEGKVP